MTSYVFAYDLEDPDLCLRAAPRLVELHRRYEIPATFFVLGTVLERRRVELRALFGDDPLFDVASHTYSHWLLKDNRVHGWHDNVLKGFYPGPWLAWPPVLREVCAAYAPSQIPQLSRSRRQARHRAPGLSRSLGFQGRRRGHNS